MKPIGKNIIHSTHRRRNKNTIRITLSSEDTNQLRYKKGIVVIQGTDVTVINSETPSTMTKRAGFTMLINNEPFTIIQEKDVVVVVSLFISIIILRIYFVCVLYILFANMRIIFYISWYFFSQIIFL